MALMSCFYSTDFKDIFIILPLTGLAFETFHNIPEILADMLEIEEQDRLEGKYRNLLNFSLFYAQSLMWCFIPIVFLYFPNTDDNQWGMLISGASGILSVLFALMI